MTRTPLLALLVAVTCLACSPRPDAAADATTDSLAGGVATLDAQDAPVAREGMVDVPGGRVFYRMLGDGPGTPLLALHGGPGGTSCRFEALAPLAEGRRVIFYDQLGSGRSDQPSDTSLWTLPRFVEEVDAVRRGLGLDTIHLLGSSWGGALAAEYLIAARPEGVVSVVFSSPLISTPRWIADADSLRELLPADIQRVLATHEVAGTLNSPEYAAATDSFYARHVRRLPVTPPVQCAGVSSNREIYLQMWGPTEFRSTGSLREWSRAEDLSQITIPALFIAGEHDEAVPSTLETFRASMPDARLVVIPGAAHAVISEKTEEYVAAVGAFLREVEARRGAR